MHKNLNKSNKQNERINLFGRTGIKRTLEIILVLSLVVVGIYTVFFGTRMVSGVTRTVETAENTIRLQLINGSDDKEAGDKIASLIKDFSCGSMAIEIIEQNDFKKRDISNSIVISRDRDMRSAEYLSELVGLDPDDVVYRSLENNINLINVTLALGNDFTSIETAIMEMKEKQ